MDVDVIFAFAYLLCSCFLGWNLCLLFYGYKYKKSGKDIKAATNLDVMSDAVKPGRNVRDAILNASDQMRKGM